MSLLNVERSLRALAAAALPGWSVAQENAQFSKPEGGKWAAVWFLPAGIDVNTIGPNGEDLAVGNLQVDLNYLQNTGSLTAAEDFESIRSAFPTGAQVTDGSQVTTITGCSRLGGRQVDQWFRVSITVRWEARIPR